MRFRYRAYTGGPDPLADPDPPSREERVETVALERLRAREVDGDGEGGGVRASPAGGSLSGGLLAPPDRNGHGLTPRELRRLGETALRDIERSARGPGGGHPGGGGRGGDPTGAHTPREAGDDRPLDPVATVRAAALRRAVSPGPLLRAGDLRVAQTEPVGAAAVSLLVDLSHSMVERALHTAATRTALALHTLVRTRHPDDRIQLVGFGESARELTPARLVAHEWRRTPGTNLHHALRLARGHVRRHRGLRPLVLAVTDGEPTAHLGGDGRSRFAWPPDPRTAELTLAELDRLLREGAEVVFFLLADDPRLRDFAAEMDRRRAVRVVRADAEALGPLVVDRYLGRRG
ncbi:VWA domain-containing protein [Nocardiopsis sp. FIRDI 009]|uniref:VWA domain-containing protein n=1 Tax=Nocardiopsis sp. FIRDI 009 TaxID=714197 RepID=UPI000E256DE3|nr:VWA domain-containing protein [Nocardiopsis sp. FIRDI 009]